MKEVKGNFWTYPADVKCIPTNGSINSKGLAIMGRGVALQAATKYPGLPKALAYSIECIGNVTTILYGSFLTEGYSLWAFPVKYKWHEQADIDLICRSALQLKNQLLPLSSTAIVLLPRPGCGNGGLNWKDVKPFIADILYEDRFHIIS